MIIVLAADSEKPIDVLKVLKMVFINDIVPDIEIISMKVITASYERMLKGDVKYRFVIGMATL